MSEEPVGVLEAERRRVQMWRDLGLPDPVEVLMAEETTRSVYGPPDFRDPRRAELDEYLAANPHLRPSGW